jgi:hypothetical protein
MGPVRSTISRTALRPVLRALRAVNAAVIAFLAGRSGGRASIADVRACRFGDGFEARAYRLETPTDRGTACSVFWGRQELLRLDLLIGNPHIHFGLAQGRLLGGAAARVSIDEADRRRLIERAVYELQHNFGYCVMNHPSRRLRRIRPGSEELQRVAGWLRDELLDLESSLDR